MKTLTKTLQFRTKKSGYGGIVRSTKDKLFLLVPHSHMVQIENVTLSTYGTSSFSTYTNHSLPIEIVKRIVGKPAGTRGKIRNGWWYIVGATSLEIGCQRFTGDNLAALQRWARA